MVGRLRLLVYTGGERKSALVASGTGRCLVRTPGGRRSFVGCSSTPHGIRSVRLTIAIRRFNRSMFSAATWQDAGVDREQTRPYQERVRTIDQPGSFRLIFMPFSGIDLCAHPVTFTREQDSL